MQGGLEKQSDGVGRRPLLAGCGGECADKLSRVVRAGKELEEVLVEENLFLEFPAGGFAEGLEGGKRNEVRAANTKGLKLRAVYSAFYPLVYGLPRDRRINALPCLLNTEVVTRLAVVASRCFPAPFTTGAANSEMRKSVTEVHECQAYHTLIARAMPCSLFIPSREGEPFRNQGHSVAGVESGLEQVLLHRGGVRVFGR